MFFTASVSNVLNPQKSANQIARVYWRYLKATRRNEGSVPGLDQWQPLPDPLLNALERGPDAISKELLHFSRYISD